MDTIASRPAPVKPIPAPDRPAAPVVAFGARVRRVTLPGTWRVVAVMPFSDTLRVRQLASDGSLIGRVMVWTLKELAPAEPAADAVAPTRVHLGSQSAVYTVTTAKAPLTEAQQAAKDERERPFPEDEDLTPPARARAPVVTMAIVIDGTAYAVSPLAPAPESRKAYRLEKAGGDGAVYDLDESSSGARCTCGDFVWRHEGNDWRGCKHLVAARLMGLFGDFPITAARTAYDARREAEANLQPVPLPEVEPFHPVPLDLAARVEDGDHVRSIGAGDPLDPRTFDADLDADEDDAPSSWDDASSWTTTEDDADPEDRWAPESEPVAAPAKARKARLPRAKAAPPVPPSALPLAAGLAARIAGLRSEHTPLADLMADRLDGLLAQVEALEATTVEDYRDRLATLRGDAVGCFEG